jgi:hypothetical protein
VTKNIIAVKLRITILSGVIMYLLPYWNRRVMKMVAAGSSKMLVIYRDKAITTNPKTQKY